MHQALIALGREACHQAGIGEMHGHPVKRFDHQKQDSKSDLAQALADDAAERARGFPEVIDYADDHGDEQHTDDKLRDLSPA